MSPSRAFRCGEHVVSLDRVAVMGILNVTPDSFSDGGMWVDPDAAVAHARVMADEGAAIIDVGGESTRPGADEVSEEEELRRVVPVIERLVGEVSVPISIDTRKAAVAEAAIAAGASIINDTTGEESDGSLGKVAGSTKAGIIVMHSRGTPATMTTLTDYEDLVPDVTRWLVDRAKSLLETGVRSDSIVVDPGIGFAKTPEQNLQLLRDIDALVATGWPVLSGTSRKSFLGAVLDLPEDDRLEGSVASACWAVSKGARLVRVHDVAPTVRAVRVIESILAGG
ncbi:MAG TPA: dihydropteroate synthase [Actinomycetota bacterium]|nr:dihydropteroate synthase [Actinomycetota bacterium]